MLAWSRDDLFYLYCSAANMLFVRLVSEDSNCVEVCPADLFILYVF